MDFPLHHVDSFEENPVYRFAKRPSELYSQLYAVDRIELKKGEIKKLLLILTVTSDVLPVSEEVSDSDVISICRDRL